MHAELDQKYLLEENSFANYIQMFSQIHFTVEIGLWTTRKMYISKSIPWQVYIICNGLIDFFKDVSLKFCFTATNESIINYNVIPNTFFEQTDTSFEPFCDNTTHTSKYMNLSIK